MKDTYTLREALHFARNYCAYQERCHQEVETKLREMKMIPEAILSIINELIEHDYLNEERYARSLARGKFRIKKWGKNRIVRELQRKDISKYNIALALSEISEAEYQTTLNDLAHKRLDALNETNKYKRKRKLCDYLLYRGWEPHLVYDKANELIN